MNAMDALVHDVESLLRHVAEEEILSRFKKLERDEIRAKSAHPRDLVTTADLEAENRLVEGLTRLIPESVVVAEEEASRHPEVLERISGDAPVWSVDPLDGTGNFAHGKPCFAMICALIEGGETQMGWIFDPIAGVCATVRRGEGVYLGGQKIVLDTSVDIERMTGSLGHGMKKRLEKRKNANGAGWPQHVVRYHCCGREYLDMLVGKLHFIVYGGRLMPWDHAAGTLMIEEASGFARLRGDKSAYDPAHPHGGGELLLATSAGTFDELDRMLKDLMN